MMAFDAFCLLIFSYKNSELLPSFLPHESHIRHSLRPFINRMASDKNCRVRQPPITIMILYHFFAFSARNQVKFM